VYKALGGLEENHLTVAYNDVDYCLRLRSANLKVLYTPYAELTHHESVSRGFDNTIEKKIRIQRETAYMRQHWAKVIENDPYYNPNLSLEDESFSIAFPPRFKAIDWFCI
jgi:GT2 family glycosyltransferase